MIFRCDCVWVGCVEGEVHRCMCMERESVCVCVWICKELEWDVYQSVN